MDKKSLTAEQVKNVLDKLAAEEFVYSEEPFFSERTTWIYVNDYDGPVKACYYYKQDGIKNSAPSVNVCFRIVAAGLTFSCSSDYEDLDDWVLESDEFAMPEDSDLLNTLTDALSQHLPEFEYGVRDYAMDKYDDYCLDLEDEWTEEEIIEEIEKELTYSQYVEIDGKIYPVEDSLEETLEEHGLDIDSEGYAVLTPREAAAALAEDIDMGDNSF